MTTPVDELPFLHRDEHIVAVSKPSGLLVHPGREGPAEPCALKMVRDRVGAYVYLGHRLDRAASGVLVFALSPKIAARLQEAMHTAEQGKEYRILCRWPGTFPRLPDAWRCVRPLTDERDIPRRARSEFRLLEAFRGCALVEARIATGRYHQIRRHCNHTGRHVLGDTTHGKGRLNALFRERYGLHRLFLHLHRVTLRHPVTGADVALHSPLPADLESVLAALRAERAAV